MRTGFVGVVRSQLTRGAVLVLLLIAGVATGRYTLGGVLLAGAVVLMLAWPLFQRLAREASWALPLVVAVLLILLDFGVFSSSTGLIRYTPTVVVLAIVVAMRGGGVRSGFTLWMAAAVFCCYGLFGTIYGRMFLGTQDGALPVVLPIFICLVGWARQVGDDVQLRFALKVIAFLCSVFALGCAAINLAGLSGETSVFSHEKAFLIVLAVACASAARSRWLVVLSLVGALAAFATYPAATYVVAALTGLLTFALVRWSPDRSTRTLLGVGAMAGVLWAVLHVDFLVGLTGAYFTTVEKTDNGSTRVTLYQSALQHLSAEPVFAHLFTGDLTVATTLSGQRGVVLPIHNDYLGIAMSGGIVASALLLFVFMLANGYAIHAVKVCGFSSTRGRAITALLTSVNTAAVIAFANPIFMNPETSTAFYAIMFALISLGLPA